MIAYPVALPAHGGLALVASLAALWVLSVGLLLAFFRGAARGRPR